jgi:hypothetical protein
MLHALLATMGTLAVLVSIVAKLAVARAGATARDAAGGEGSDDVVPVLLSAHGDRSCRRVRRRVRGRSGATHASRHPDQAI